MIAEDAQPPVSGRERDDRASTTPDTLRAPAADPPATTGRPRPGLEGGAQRAAAAAKPRLRGWLHAAMFPIAVAGGIALITLARPAATAACSVYALSVCLLLGTSGVYHRGTWGPRGEPSCGGWTTRTSS